LLDIAAELEARLDHPDDDLSMESDEGVAKALKVLSSESSTLADSWESSKVRQEGASVALIGPVNAGKSSLFNHLVGTERALVSDRPGTTRDVVERSILMDGLDVTFLDTAGEGGTSDPLEAAGVALGRSLSSTADLILVVIPEDRELSPVCRDLLSRTQGLSRLIVGTFQDKKTDSLSLIFDVSISNVDGTGIDQLRGMIRERIGSAPSQGQQTTLLSQRQHDLFRAIALHCDAAAEALLGALGPAVSVTEVVHAVERLGELMGIDAREAVLDRLFSRFCIGK
jgi:tRNA modification GTPase